MLKIITIKFCLAKSYENGQWLTLHVNDKIFIFFFKFSVNRGSFSYQCLGQDDKEGDCNLLSVAKPHKFLCIINDPNKKGKNFLLQNFCHLWDTVTEEVYLNDLILSGSCNHWTNNSTLSITLLQLLKLLFCCCNVLLRTHRNTFLSTNNHYMYDLLEKSFVQ